MPWDYEIDDYDYECGIIVDEILLGAWKEKTNNVDTI